MARLQLRPYQKECVDRAKAQNTIVNLPTGKGKTLIAVRLIEYYLQRYPEKSIAFLVQTRPLVVQQAKYCEDNCEVGGSPPRVQKLIGEDQSDWGKLGWDDCMKHCHVVLGISALFQKAFVTDKYIDVAQFSLIIFDECHHAVGNSPMAAVMRDAVAPHTETGLEPPRILGLTASFVNGSLHNMLVKRQALEKLLNSTIIAPQVETNLTEESFIYVRWAVDDELDNQKEAIALHVEHAAGKIDLKDVRKLVSRCTHVFGELGFMALLFYLEKVVVLQVLQKADTLELMEDQACKTLANKLRAAVPGLRLDLDVLTSNLHSSLPLSPTTHKSNKLLQLLNLLKKNFDHRPRGDNSYRGIVFVEQVALVSSLANQINLHLEAQGIKCGAVAGTGHQTETHRQEQLQAFQSAEYQVLVATATLEEGIDVSACEFVIRFTRISTTMSHIQGSGRARHPNAMIYYFDNDPSVEMERAAELTAAARNTALALSSGELDDALRDMNTGTRRHPFPFNSREKPTDDGEVNVYNCKQILNQYCSITLGKSISPKTELYKFDVETRSSRKVLVNVRYPTPDGWQSKASADYMAFWAGEDMSQVFSPDRVKKKSASEKEEMAFVFVVVVTLRELGYLDSHNKPDPSIRFAIRRNCLLQPQSPAGLKLKANIFQSPP